MARPARTILRVLVFALLGVITTFIAALVPAAAVNPWLVWTGREGILPRPAGATHGPSHIDLERDHQTGIVCWRVTYRSGVQQPSSLYDQPLFDEVDAWAAPFLQRFLPNGDRWPDYPQLPGSANAGREVAVVVATGWPLPAMAFAMVEDLPACPRPTWTAIGAIELKGLNYSKGGNPVMLPARPIWGGFAIDAICWSAAWVIVLLLPGVARRGWRRMHGQCTACG